MGKVWAPGKLVWREVLDPQGRPYWYSRKTRQSQWVVPSEQQRAERLPTSEAERDCEGEGGARALGRDEVVLPVEEEGGGGGTQAPETDASAAPDGVAVVPEHAAPEADARGEGAQDASVLSADAVEEKEGAQPPAAAEAPASTSHAAAVTATPSGAAVLHLLRSSRASAVEVEGGEDAGVAARRGGEAAPAVRALVFPPPPLAIFPRVALRKRPDGVALLLDQLRERVQQRRSEGGDGTADQVEGLIPLSVPGGALSPSSAPLQLFGWLWKGDRGLSIRGLWPARTGADVQIVAGRVWRRRFFLTQRWHLFYYASDETPAMAPLAAIDLRFTTDLPPPLSSAPSTLVLSGTGRGGWGSYHLRARGPADALSWREGLLVILRAYGSAAARGSVLEAELRGESSEGSFLAPRAMHLPEWDVAAVEGGLPPEAEGRPDEEDEEGAVAGEEARAEAGGAVDTRMDMLPPPPPPQRRRTLKRGGRKSASAPLFAQRQLSPRLITSVRAVARPTAGPLIPPPALPPPTLAARSPSSSSKWSAHVDSRSASISIGARVAALFVSREQAHSPPRLPPPFEGTDSHHLAWRTPRGSVESAEVGGSGTAAAAAAAEVEVRRPSPPTPPRPSAAHPSLPPPPWARTLPAVPPSPLHMARDDTLQEAVASTVARLARLTAAMDGVEVGQGEWRLPVSPTPVAKVLELNAEASPVATPARALARLALASGTRSAQSVLERAVAASYSRPVP
jgi:hypothetical protein